METAVHHHCLGQISPYTSPPPTNHHLTKAMRLKANLSLKRFSAANIIAINNSNSNRFLDSEILCVNTQTNSMATKNNQQHESTTTTTKKVEDEEKEAKQLPPPPPEKPLPGDCCGSGCVRCVWDVYYEELESYNLLYKSDSDDSKSKPS